MVDHPDIEHCMKTGYPPNGERKWRTFTVGVTYTVAIAHTRVTEGNEADAAEKGKAFARELLEPALREIGAELLDCTAEVTEHEER